MSKTICGNPGNPCGHWFVSSCSTFNSTPANGVGKPVEESPSVLTPATHMEDLDKALGCLLQPSPWLASVAIW